MIQNKGKIKMPNAKASEAVQKALFEMGFEWMDNKKNPVHCMDPYIFWGQRSNYLTYCDDQGRFKRCSFPAHTLADFGLNPEGEPLVTFKDGDRVVCDEALKQVISEGGLATTYDAYKEPFVLSCLNPEALEATNEYGRFNVSNKGVVYNLAGDYVGRILHAPTFGNLKPSDPHKYEFGDKVKVSDAMGPHFALFENGIFVYAFTEHDWVNVVQKGNPCNPRVFHSDRVMPWPEPVTILLAESYPTIVSTDSIEVTLDDSTLSLPLSIIDELVAARKKVTGK